MHKREPQYRPSKDNSISKGLTRNQFLANSLHDLQKNYSMTLNSNKKRQERQSKAEISRTP